MTCSLGCGREKRGKKMFNRPPAPPQLPWEGTRRFMRKRTQRRIDWDVRQTFFSTLIGRTRRPKRAWGRILSVTCATRVDSNPRKIISKYDQLPVCPCIQLPRHPPCKVCFLSFLRGIIVILLCKINQRTNRSEPTQKLSNTIVIHIDLSHKLQ